MTMKAEEAFALGLGLNSPWKPLSQRFDMEAHPFELHLEIGADRGAKYPCPTCGAMCAAHDFEDMSWAKQKFFCKIIEAGSN